MLREAVGNDLAEFYEGTITAPAATTFIDADLVDSAESDEQYVGAWVMVTESGSPAEGVVRRISAYDPATGQITISRAWAPAPAPGDEYELHTLLSPDDLEQCIAVGMGKCMYVDRWIVDAVADQREYILSPPSIGAYNWIEQAAAVRNVYWCPGAVHVSDTSIAFAATDPGTITDANNNFERFATGDVIVVRGSAENDGTYTVSTGGVAGTIRTREATLVEAAAATVTILATGAIQYRPLRRWRVTENAGVFSLHVRPYGTDGVYVVEILRRYATLNGDETTSCPVFWAVAAAEVEVYRLLARKDPGQDSTRFKQAQAEAAARFATLTRRYQPRPKIRIHTSDSAWAV